MGFLSCIAYGLMATFVSFVNKALMNNYHYQHVSVLLLLSCLSAVIALRLGSVVSLVHITPTNLSVIKRAGPLAFLHCVNVAFSLFGLKLLPIPMFFTLRRTTTIFILVLEFVMLRQINISRLKIVSVLMLGVGSIVAGWGDLDFNVAGFLFVMGNNLASALYSIYIKYLDSEDKSWNTDDKGNFQKLNKLDKLYYSSLLSSPFLFLTIVIEGEFGVLTGETPSALGWNFGLVLFLFAIFGGCLIQLSIFWCTSATSPLALSVTGNIKDVGASLLSIVLFGSSQIPDPVEAVGLIISMLAAFIYSFASVREHDQEPPKHNDKDPDDDFSNEIDILPPPKPNKKPIKPKPLTKPRARDV